MSILAINFCTPSFKYRLLKGGGRRQPLARAIGLKPGFNPTVLDATAGLGHDAFVLAYLGCHVTLCERSKEVAAGLKQALEEAREDPMLAEAAGRIDLYEVDAIDYLNRVKTQEQTGTSKFDVIYLDPMYPEKPGRAAVNQAMTWLQETVGQDLDVDILFKEALTKAPRVVVKRPKWAEVLGNVEPHHVILMSKHRFDVYCR